MVRKLGILYHEIIYPLCDRLNTKLPLHIIPYQI